MPLIPSFTKNHALGMIYNNAEFNPNWLGRKILVVEDSYKAYDLIRMLFANSGAEFVLETDGLQALNRCRNDFSIELVLMDIQLPLMDGYESTRQIKKFRPNLPIIAQTANALSKYRRKAKNAGCDDYINKPLDRKELAVMISTYLSVNDN